MTGDIVSPREDELAAEIAGLRRLLAQAGIDAAERTVAERLQRLLVEELHHRVKNMLATVMSITSHCLRTAKSLSRVAELDQRTTLRIMSALGGCGRRAPKEVFGF
jgi:HWE histidine kinase